MNSRLTIRLLATLATALATSIATAIPIDTTITYQGELMEGGVPANGEYAMRFRLFNGETTGGQVGPVIEFRDGAANPPVMVENGRFTVELDFFNGPYSGGQALWLQIELRPVNGASFTTLMPRQRITASPFAILEAVPA